MGLYAFIRAEQRADHPLLPLAFFRQRDFSASLGSQFASNFAYMGGFILAPTLLARMFDYGETKIGFFVLARPLTG